MYDLYVECEMQRNEANTQKIKRNYKTLTSSSNIYRIHIASFVAEFAKKNCPDEKLLHVEPHVWYKFSSVGPL